MPQNTQGSFLITKIIVTFLICGIVYYKTRKTLKKYEKEFAKEIEHLSDEKRKALVENSKVASQVLSSYNKSI